MSKLYTKYTKLKEKNPNTVYLFKAGIFYLALGEDAIRLSVSLKLNLGKLVFLFLVVNAMYAF